MIFWKKYMAVGIVKNICFNLDKRQPTKTMKLILKKIIFPIFHMQANNKN